MEEPYTADTGRNLLMLITSLVTFLWAGVPFSSSICHKSHLNCPDHTSTDLKALSKRQSAKERVSVEEEKLPDFEMLNLWNFLRTTDLSEHHGFSRCGDVQDKVFVFFYFDVCQGAENPDQINLMLVLLEMLCKNGLSSSSRKNKITRFLQKATFFPFTGRTLERKRNPKHNMKSLNEQSERLQHNG